MNNIENLSLVERYAHLRGLNPAKDLIEQIMEATGRSEITVRMWFSSETFPSMVKPLIARALNTSVEILFPTA